MENNLIKPYVKNEWGQLKEIIVGDVSHAQVPTVGDKCLHSIDYAHLSDEEFKNRPSGLYDRKVLEETQKDLHEIAKTLESLGVKVHRPRFRDFSKIYKTDNWEVDGYYNYCPRDTVLIVNDKAIEVPMTLRHRQNEAEETLKPLFDQNHWVQAPRPKLLDSIYQREDLSKPTLLDGEPVFDAANVIKHNNDLLYLVSNTGNKDGAKWLETYCKETFGNEYNVHTAEGVYAYIHIDTTFVFLREGLVLVNPSRVNWRNMPHFISTLDRIWAPEPYPTQVMEDWCPASPWLGMNILPINSELCMVEEHQVLLMKELKKWGIESIPVKLRHARTLSGGPHCVTLDVVRDVK
jgi:glycine amidinotransferase/scyllo-inosamine-4-phosphate amidinotransferase 1